LCDEEDEDTIEKVAEMSLGAPEDLRMPPFPNPMKDLGKISENVEMDFLHGTTCLGFKFQGGVILAVDSRATGGQHIYSGTVRKIIKINNWLAGTMAGGAADCQYWLSHLDKETALYELRNGERMSVAASSKLLSNIMYRYKGMGLSMGSMIAGYDKRGPGLYYVDSDGTRTPGDVFSVGSGSVYAYGVLDKGYRWDLKDEEAQELGRRAIYQATYRDIASGGIVRVVQMTKDGYKVISEQDCMELHYHYNPVDQDAPME